jgi:ABC-type glycerol-3-phosphate transport system substrate-binding protein
MNKIVKMAVVLALILIPLQISFAGGEQEPMPGKTLEYASMWNEGEPQAAYFQQMAQDFEEETGAKVEITSVGRSVLTQIRPRLISNDPPDLVDQSMYFRLKGALLGDEILATPLDDFFYNEKGPEGQGRLGDIFDENLLKLYAYEGHQYFFPYANNTSGFHYDKNLFAKYGLKVPTTWSEFMANNKVLKDNGVFALALDGTVDTYSAYYYFWAANRIVGPGALRTAAFDATGKTWDDPGYLQAAQLIYELTKAGKFYFQDGYDADEWPAGQATWALGEAGSLLCGTWIPSETKPTAKADFDYGFYAFPAVEGGRGKVTQMETSLIGFAIPKGAKNPELAKEFLKFISRKDNVNTFVQMSNNIAARKDAAFPELLKDVRPLFAKATGYVLSYNGVSGDLADWFEQYFLAADDQFIWGKLPPQQFISQLKANTIKYWEAKK